MVSKQVIRQNDFDIEENNTSFNEITNTNLFTKKEILKDVVEDDTSFEITAYVRSIFQIKSSEKNGKKWHLFNFIVCNGEDTIQVTAWNDLAFKYANLITKTEQVYTLQKVVPKVPFKKEFLHNASFPFELLIRPCTIVIHLGIYKIPQQIEEISLTEMRHARAKNDLIIEMNYYIKMIFVKSQNQNFYIGAITDGYYKLCVLVTNDGDFEKEFTYGSKVKVTGRIRISENKPPYLSVSTTSNVQLLNEEKMPFLDTLNGYHPIP